jgi:hypothetical protein
MGKCLETEGWDTVEAPDGMFHVVPTNDLRPHGLDTACWCQPFDDEGVWVHNSLDRREFYEVKGYKQ